jgi:hypothetical protein
MPGAGKAGVDPLFRRLGPPKGAADKPDTLYLHLLLRREVSFRQRVADSLRISIAERALTRRSNSAKEDHRIGCGVLAVPR